MEPDPPRELERQVERGHVFLHAVLAQHANRAGDNEAIIRGLVELLIEREIVQPGELVAAVEAVRPQTSTEIEVSIRTDAAQTTDGAPVDCAARMHVCHAVCCRLRFPLTIAEVEAGGPLKWDLGRPYFNRQAPNGYCHCFDDASHGCTVYNDRPTPCRVYSCAGDDRIWKDFEGMVINQEWIDAHLGAERSPIEIFMETAENA